MQTWMKRSSRTGRPSSSWTMQSEREARICQVCTVAYTAQIVESLVLHLCLTHWQGLVHCLLPLVLLPQTSSCRCLVLIVMCHADPAVNKTTASSAMQRILPESDVAMEEAGPSKPSEQ